MSSGLLSGASKAEVGDSGTGPWLCEALEAPFELLGAMQLSRSKDIV